MMRTAFDAIVVGAGPAGSTAAILLARAGWSVALVEKQRFPRRKVCGECIAASNLPLLAALGLAERVQAQAGPELRRVGLMRGEQTAVAALPAGDHDPYRWGRALGREALDVMLLEQARSAGAFVLQPWAVRKLEGTAGDFRCELRAVGSHGSLALRAPLAVAAHGSWEALPSARGAERAVHRGSDLLAFKANFRGASLADGFLPVLSLHGGYGGMVVAGAGVTTLACCLRRDRLDASRRALPGVPVGEVVETLLKRECAGVREALQFARREGPWLACGPLDPGTRLGREEDVFRIGNAAGEAHPIIGEGISMALQSAWLLCGLLIDGDAGGVADDAGHRTCGTRAPHAPAWQRAIKRAYEVRWRRRFEPRLRLAAVFAHLAMRPAAAMPLAALVRRWPALLTHGAKWAGKVDCPVDARIPAAARTVLASGRAAATDRPAPPS